MTREQATFRLWPIQGRNIAERLTPRFGSRIFDWPMDVQLAYIAHYGLRFGNHGSDDLDLDIAYWRHPLSLDLHRDLFLLEGLAQP